MNPRDKIQIIDLLARREQEFRTVASCEKAICDLLGGFAYPFPLPPDLPSRRNARKTAPKTPKAAELPRLAWLRKLQPPAENAYKIIYLPREQQEPLTDFQADFELLHALAELELQGALEILRLETGLLREDGSWQTGQLLLNRENCQNAEELP